MRDRIVSVEERLEARMPIDDEVTLLDRDQPDRARRGVRHTSGRVGEIAPDAHTRPEWVRGTLCTPSLIAVHMVPHRVGWSSSRRESHPPALTEPDVTLSRHPAPLIQP